MKKSLIKKDQAKTRGLKNSSFIGKIQQLALYLNYLPDKQFPCYTH